MSDHQATSQTIDPPPSRLECRLTEAYDDLWDSLVDPREAFFDQDGTRWRQIGGGDAGAAGAFASEEELRQVRGQCRELAATNEFAINGHENRISFVVGTGHSYRATVRKGLAETEATFPSHQLAHAVQALLDDFCQRNHWQRRQQELLLRRDRDGEAFLRFFAEADGTTRVRFVEPGQVATPPDRADDPAATFGILTEPFDVESVLAYFIDGRPVAADDIQHRKGNVDRNVKRGLPLFYPVRKNLRRAEKLLRNMSVVAEIQSAIALVRKHHRGTRGGVEQFVAAAADLSLAQAATGRTSHYKRYAPGTILDVHGGVEYDFPAAGVNAANFVIVLQAELRAIASRLVMPEFMLTSDASNANYASTMVAEGPAVRMFARLQAEQAADDLEVMWRVVSNAIAAGRLAAEALTQIEIQVDPPTLAVRDALAEAQAFRIEQQAGILSPQTWSQRRGLDYDQEQENLAQHQRRAAGPAPARSSGG